MQPRLRVVGQLGMRNASPPGPADGQCTTPKASTMGTFFSFMYAALKFIFLKTGRLFWVLLVLTFNTVLFFFKLINDEKSSSDDQLHPINDINDARDAAAQGRLGGAETAAYEEMFGEQI